MAAPLGHIKWGGRKKGTPNKETLTKLERRALFDAKVSQVWNDLIEQLPAVYIADQYLGKATEKIEHSGELNVKKEDITSEVLKEVKARNKKRLIDGERQQG